jgi:GNAT superfamily N-acetyltransferase
MFAEAPMSDFLIQPLLEADLPAAREVVREAFATFMGAAAPGEFWNDRDYVEGRWRAPHTVWFKIELDGGLAGVAGVARWGSHGVVGPVAVRPKYWERKLAKALMSAVTQQLDTWGVVHAGLFTFPDSPRHLGLYQTFGFWPQALTAVVERDAAGSIGAPVPTVATLSTTDLADCAALTGSVAEGLDVRGELQAVEQLKLGANLLLRDAHGALEAFAACHFGPRSEAGDGVCYVKFAAVRGGGEAPERMNRLLAACDNLAAAQGQRTLMLGVNTGRRHAYQHLLQAGFAIRILGITLHRGTGGYDHCASWVFDDWR